MVAVVVIIMVSLLQPSGEAVFCKGEGEGARGRGAMHTAGLCQRLLDELPMNFLIHQLTFCEHLNLPGKCVGSLLPGPLSPHSAFV